MKTLRRNLARLCTALAVMAVTGHSLAQTFPSRPLKIVVPFGPGGGSISLSFLNIAGVMPQLKAGQLRPLGVTTLKRLAVLVDLPATNDILPGFEVNSWYGMMTPAGTPKAIVNQLQHAVAKALRTPDVAEKLAQLWLHGSGSTPKAHAAQIRSDLERWAKIAKTANLKIN